MMFGEKRDSTLKVHLHSRTVAQCTVNVHLSQNVPVPCPILLTC